MRSLLFILSGVFLFYSAVGQAKPKVRFFKNTKRFVSSVENLEKYFSNCKKEFALEGQKYGGLNFWMEQAPSSDGGKSFRSPTGEFGRWLEVSINSFGYPVLYDVTKQTTQKIVFEPNCTTVKTESKGLNFSVLKPDNLASWFGDDHLRNLLENTKSGIIYVWSPEMVYSAKYYKYFFNVAKKLNLKFTALIDPRASITQADEMAKIYGIPTSNLKLNSVELYMRNVTIHYPTTIIYHGGKIHNLSLVGVMEPEQLEREVKQRMLELF